MTFKEYWDTTVNADIRGNMEYCVESEAGRIWQAAQKETARRCTEIILRAGAYGSIDQIEKEFLND